MDERYDDEDIEDLTERLLRVENALFYRKARRGCLSCPDLSDEERLERLRAQLRSRLEGARIAQDAIAG